MRDETGSNETIEQAGPGGPTAKGQEAPRSRRALLLGALGALAGAGMGALARATPTQAASGDPIVAGRVNSSGTSATTLFASSSSPALTTFNFGTGDGISAVAVDRDQDGLAAYSRATMSGNGSAVRGDGGLNTGVIGSSSGSGRTGVSGQHSGSGGIAVQGQSSASLGAGVGVHGTSAGDTGSGLHGTATNGTGRTHGVLGESASNGGAGVLGRSSATRSEGGRAVGVRGESAAFAGVWGESSAPAGLGVVGQARAIGESDPAGVYGDTSARSGAGVEGWSRSTAGAGYGVYGTSDNASGIGVRGTSTATSGATYGVYGDVSSPGGLALFGLGHARVTGDMTAQGTATAAAARYRIDHPTSAAPDRTLSHGLVGSNEWKNVYDGTAVCNAGGEAVVSLPSWFGRLNRETRIQLTPIGAPAPLFVANKVSGNQFVIAGGAPGQEVYWQVTGVRRDRWAEAHPLRVEETKRGKEAGRLLHPEERGAAASRGVTEAFRLARRRRRVR